jgi:branched-chain amino acid transport system permease protein
VNRKSQKLVAGLALLVALLVLPHLLEFHHQDLLIFLTINVLVVTSYRLVTLTGEWSLIHAVMMGVGGYTATLLFKNFELGMWFTLPLAGIVAALVACWIEFVQPFGGTGGLSGVEPPLLGEIDFLEPVPYYYLTLGVVGLCLLILYRIENSRIGLTLHSVHWKAPLAESVGVNTWRYRALAFVIGSFFVGIAGGLKVHYLGTITPNQFGIGFMVFILIWVIVGGYNRFYGPILGVVVLTIFDESIRSFEEIRPAIYGAVLILSILFLPLGLESLPACIRRWLGIGKGPAESRITDG